MIDALPVDTTLRSWLLDLSGKLLFASMILSLLSMQISELIDQPFHPMSRLKFKPGPMVK